MRAFLAALALGLLAVGLWLARGHDDRRRSPVASPGASDARPGSARRAPLLRAVDVSEGRSPVAGCRAREGGSGAVSVGSEVEPFVASDPRHPATIVGVYQQDRFFDGQARAIGAVVSRDGGRSWTRSLLPFSRCARPSSASARVGDPWVSIGPRRAVYAIAAGRGIVAAVSREGRGWGTPVMIERSTRRFFLDKPSVTADPARPGTAFAVWLRWWRLRGAPPTTFDAMLAVTHDFGRSWSRRRVLVRHTRTGGAASSQILIDRRTGSLYHLANWEQGGLPSRATPARIIVQRSGDGGRTWSRPATAARVRTRGYRPLGGSGVFVRTAVENSDFAIDPRTGALYAVWQDGRFSGYRRDSVALSRSLDSGRVWSRPRRVDAAGTATAGVPSVAIDASGRVGVSYYSLRPAGGVARARFVVATSRDGGRHFSVTASSAATSLANAPRVFATSGARGAFLGDYTGLEGTRSGFLALYALPAGDPADVFFSRFGVEDSRNALTRVRGG